jgi:FeS assembly SUF system protein
MTSRPVRFTPNPGTSDTAQSVPADAPLEQRVIAALRTIYDPELPVNIYDLGLIYNIDIKDDHSVDIKMTLTAPACPVAGSLPGQVEGTIKTLNDVTDASVELVWDPPWDKERMSDEAKMLLDMY